MKVAFWNLRKSTASNLCVHGLVDSEKPDLLVLAEYNGFDKDKPPNGYVYLRLSERLAILSTTKATAFPPKDKLSKFAQVVQIRGWSVAVCHLKSPLNDGISLRNDLMRRLKTHLKDTVIPWTKLVVIGDLNANPWEDAIVDKMSLHGLQTRAEANQGLDYDGEHYPALLNVSYQLARSFPAGSGEVWGTYRDKEEKLHASLRWHILDQALVTSDVKATVSLRTELPALPWFEGLGKQRNESPYPDHLPIVVELETI